MTSAPRRYVLTLGCRDTTGIVARISGFLHDVGGWIVEAAYHSDTESGWFFTRQAVLAESVTVPFEELSRRFAELATGFGDDSQWSLRDSATPTKVVALVSREGHCLGDLLGRVYRRELDAEIVAVIGNHPDLADFTRRFDVPFHHVPFGAGPGAGGGHDKAAAFAQVREIVDAHEPDAIVLARFMQILPDELCTAWAGRAINIHHSFLPSFVGARPYHQAHMRGVKLIGATCHYVSAELDAGPIIEQDVIRVDHTDAVADMIRQGRDIETLVLARGLRWHLENRVLVHAGKTVVFR